jgi:hypothetical protein
MLEFITVPLVVGIVTLGIYGLFELFVRRKERLVILEKYGVTPGSSVLSDKISLPSFSGNSFGALKIACLLLGVGLGLLTGFFISMGWLNNGIPIGVSEWQMRETTGIIYGASVLIFGGLGLLIAFFVEQKYAAEKK